MDDIEADSRRRNVAVRWGALGRCLRGVTVRGTCGRLWIRCIELLWIECIWMSAKDGGRGAERKGVVGRAKSLAPARVLCRGRGKEI